MDLSTLPLAELKDLLNLIPAEIKRREKDEKAKLIKDLEALAAERGFSLGDLIDSGATAPKTKVKGTVAAKYENPSDSSVTWTGRGRQPKWVVEAIANGGSLETLLIK